MLSFARACVERLGLGALAGVALLAAAGGPSSAQVAPPAAAKPAAAPAPAGAAAAAKLEKGRGIFSDFGCGSCHSLGDAGATGHVGPSLDGNANVTEDFVSERVANGQGVMPSFSSQLSPEEIAAVAAYVAKVSMK